MEILIAWSVFGVAGLVGLITMPDEDIELSIRLTIYLVLYGGGAYLGLSLLMALALTVFGWQPPNW